MKQEQLSVTYIAPQYKPGVIESYGAQCIADFVRRDIVDAIGYMTDEEAIEKINQHAGKLASAGSDFWASWQSINASDIASVIEDAVVRASERLKLPEIPLYCFIFPWSTDPETSSLFGGVNAVALQGQVIHLFIDPMCLNFKRSLLETIVHEYTHLYYYQTSNHHGEYTLYEHMLMEGIAEVFREEVVGGQPAPWAVSLDRQGASDILQHVGLQLNTTDEQTRDLILFGGEKYKRWTGYSIGYHVVSQERTNFLEEWTGFIERLRTTQPLLIAKTK